MNRDPARPILMAYKGNKCAMCGTSVDDVRRRYGISSLFDFHHKDAAKKHPDYENLIRRSFREEQLDEVDKCVILCKTCHAIEQAQRLRGSGELTVSLDDRIVAMPFTIHSGIFDYEALKICAFTDDKVSSRVYHVRLGEGILRRYLEVELQRDKTMVQLIDETRKCGLLTIHCEQTGRLMFQAKRLQRGLVEFTFPGDCSLLTGMFPAKDRTLYVRNGDCMDDTGKFYGRHFRFTVIAVYPDLKSPSQQRRRA